jgi:hypothetical protein
MTPATKEQLAEAERIRSEVVHDPNTYLKRISDDMSALRKDFDKLFTYINRAEQYVPEHFRRFAMAFHDVYHIRNAHSELGIPIPKHLDRAIELLSDKFKHVVDDLEAEGGAFNKTRKEVVERGDYQFDHSIPLLTAAKAQEASDEETRAK